MPSVLVFGNPESEFVRATFLGWAFPDRDDSGDGNWLKVGIEVVAAPFSGSFEGMWRAEFLPPFRKALQELYSTLQGEAIFGPDWEGSLELRLRGDNLGHIAVTGEACADAATGPWLRFSLPEIDQTYLPDLISELESLEEQFPAK